MAKSFSLDGLVNPDAEPERKGQGASKPKATRVGSQAKPGLEPPTRAMPAVPNGPHKRLSLTLDAETYRALRLHAVETDRTHQAILEEATRAYLRMHAST